MNTAASDNFPCDGEIPENWEMPELESRISHDAQSVLIDFRGLSSPAPLVGTLKTLARLGPNMYFEGIYPQPPIHLFPALMEEGWAWEVVGEVAEKWLGSG